MATITQVWSNKKKTDRWKVQIRRKGIKTFCINFNTKKEAEKWAQENEEEFIKNPKPFFSMDRLALRRKREFKRLR